MTTILAIIFTLIAILSIGASFLVFFTDYDEEEGASDWWRGM